MKSLSIKYFVSANTTTNMKTFVALLALVAVACAAPAGPLVQIIVNVEPLKDGSVQLLPEPVPADIADGIVLPAPALPEVIEPGTILPDAAMPLPIPEGIILPAPALPTPFKKA